MLREKQTVILQIDNFIALSKNRIRLIARGLESITITVLIAIFACLSHIVLLAIIYYILFGDTKLRI